MEPKEPSIKNAVILAGGRGERLWPLTQDRPKCMVEVLGNPLLSYQLHWLKSHGIANVVVACGYMHQLVMDHFGDGSRFNLKITYAVEEKPLGRGGALKSALKGIGTLSEPVIALNGDHVCNLDIAELTQEHYKHKPLATIVTVPLRSPFGIVETAGDGLVAGFREKPELPYQLNAGIYMLSPGIIDLLPDVGDHEDRTFPQLVEKQQLRALSTNAFWRTVDTIKDLAELKNELQHPGSCLQAISV